MRIQLVLITVLLSLNAYSVDDKAMQELFNKYDFVMDDKKVELIDEVFTKKFIKESGGKQELIDKIKTLPTPNQKSKQKMRMTWRKGLKQEIFFAQLKEESALKNKKNEGHSDFVIILEEGKPRIDGTLSDGE